MGKLNLLLAVSRDGFVARGPNDDMRWTGSADKALFKTLTMGTIQPLLCGRTTFDLMPQLEGRALMPLSTNPGLGMSLEEAASRYPGAWLIGGPTIAWAALDRGLVRLAYISKVQASVKEGIPFRPLEKLLQDRPKAEMWVDTGVHVQVFGVKRGS